MTRKVALVAIGVNRTTILADLRGAAAGAEVLALWFRAQERFGVEVTAQVLVDESTDGGTRPIRVREVQDAVAKLVDDGSYDLLALYLAGHGIVKSGTDEQVLLSDVHLYPQEAVSVVATAQAARFCGVPHVVIISDACRNAVDPFSQLGMIAGVSVVRRKGVAGVKPTQVDLFYAAEPSQTAKEFYGEGFFTKILCSALDQAPVQICQVSEEHAPNRVIDGWLLGEYLRDRVSREAALSTPAFAQTPDAIILSRAPLFLGYAPPAESKPESTLPNGGGGAGTAVPISSPLPSFASRDSELDFLDEFSGPPPVGSVRHSTRADDGAPFSSPEWQDWSVERSPPTQIDEADDFLVSFIGDALSFADKREALKRVVWRAANPNDAGATGRGKAMLDASGLGQRVEAYLVRMTAGADGLDHRLRNRGIAVIGAKVSRVFAGEADAPSGPGQFDGMRTEDIGGPYNIVPCNAFLPSAHTVMVELNGTTAAPLPSIPGHTVTACIVDGIVQDVIIEESTRPAGEDEKARLTLQRRRAVMASLAAAGKLHLIGQLSTADVCRSVTHFDYADPTLLLYAAYGCVLAGNDSSLKKLLRYTASRLVAVPRPMAIGVAMFDLAMLSGEALTRRHALAPFCPSISLGWSLLSGMFAPSIMPPALADAASLRLNAEWTTFRSADIAPLFEALNLREVS